MIKEIVFLTQMFCENKVEHAEENTGRYGLWTMTNLVPVHFNTSSQDDPMFMLPQFNLKLTFMVPFPVWHLTLKVVLVTQRFGSLVRGVHLDKLSLMCLCFRYLQLWSWNDPVNSTLPWGTVMDSRYNYCGTFYLMQNQEILWENYMTFSLALHNGSESLCIALWKHYFRQCLDNLKQQVFYSIKY